MALVRRELIPSGVRLHEKVARGEMGRDIGGRQAARGVGARSKIGAQRGEAPPELLASGPHEQQRRLSPAVENGGHQVHQSAATAGP
jgi:hypothetical protein